jgi:hypothetical protein
MKQTIIKNEREEVIRIYFSLGSGIEQKYEESYLDRRDYHREYVDEPIGLETIYSAYDNFIKVEKEMKENVPFPSLDLRTRYLQCLIDHYNISQYFSKNGLDYDEFITKNL